MWELLAAVGMITGYGAMQIPSRFLEYKANTLCPNVIPDPNSLIAAYRKGVLTEEELRRGLKKLGYGDKAIDAMLAASAQELSPAELLHARERGVLTKDDYINGMKKLGYDEEQAEALWEATRDVVNPNEALKLYRLGKISRDEYLDALRKAGFTDDKIDQWEAINQYVPSPQDMVRFGVREAFSPEIAERLGLYEDIPEEYIEACKATGMTEEDAKRFWAAHWQLPGPGQVYEMYQRGLFGDPDSPEAKQMLDDYLRSADYSPFWREKLRELSFNPYTRIDASRMFLEDLISEDELYKNYRALGYDDEHARNLVEYYKKQKAEREAKEAEKAQKKSSSTKAKSITPSKTTAKNRDISLSYIKNAYFYNEITRDEAKQMIQALYYDPYEAEFIISVWDAQLEQKDLKDEIRLLELKYKRGLLTEDQFFEELAKLDLPGRTIDIIKLKNVKQREAYTRLPTKSELRRWLRNGYIDTETYMKYLYRMNYEPEIIALYTREVLEEL